MALLPPDFPAFFHPEWELKAGPLPYWPPVFKRPPSLCRLMLKSIGIDDLLHFDFMDPPPPETLIKAGDDFFFGKSYLAP